MSATALSALFDMVKHHAPLADFSASQEQPEGDLYLTRCNVRHAAAMQVLVDAGLASLYEWKGTPFYRLNEAARAALGSTGG